MLVNLYFADKHVAHKIVGTIITYGDCNPNITYAPIEQPINKTDTSSNTNKDLLCTHFE